MLQEVWDLASHSLAGEALPWSAGPTRPEEQGPQPAFRSPMFIGSINADLRSILAGLASAWRSLLVFVVCSGNFAAERTAPVERT